MSPGRHVDPLGRSRLKSEIDAQGEIKVVKFPVSINAAELHKSAKNATLLLRFGHRNIDTVRHARSLLERGQYFPRPVSSDIGHLFFSENWCSTRSRSYPFPSFLFFPPVVGKFTLCSVHASRIKILDLWTARFRIVSSRYPILSVIFLQGEGNMRSKMNAHFESMILVQFLRSQKWYVYIIYY